MWILACKPPLWFDHGLIKWTSFPEMQLERSVSDVASRLAAQIKSKSKKRQGGKMICQNESLSSVSGVITYLKFNKVVSPLSSILSSLQNIINVPDGLPLLQKGDQHHKLQPSWFYFLYCPHLCFRRGLVHWSFWMSGFIKFASARSQTVLIESCATAGIVPCGNLPCCSPCSLSSINSLGDAPPCLTF